MIIFRLAVQSPVCSTPSSSQSTITPSLSTSNSISNSSGSSPPQPETPVSRPGRSRSRYPELGRVPLHRRGKSQTYERLEDLLKEAGYKETRVFTPETERIERQTEQTRADGKPPRNLRGVGSVVGFITGLMPGNTLSRSSSLRETPAKSRNELPSRSNSLIVRSPPASPLPQRLTRQSHLPRSPLPNRPSTPSSIECAGPTPKASYQSPNHLGTTRSSNNSSYTSIHSQHRLHNAPPLSHHRKTPSASSALPHKPSEPILHPQPSRAGAYLRHMASVASIPPRPSSTPTFQLNLNDDDDEFAPRRRRGNGEGEEDVPPPLPKTWLETVARAVMFGGVGYVGGPQQSAKENDTRGRSADRQNLRPPDLMAQMSSRKSRRSEGEVSRTRVVCHSAPSSRPSSLSRDRGDLKEKAKAKEAARSVVPSLARTKVEGDVLDLHNSKPKHHKSKSKVKSKRFAGGWGVEVDSSSAEEVSDDDDGELDLAKILVPPKRQNSIVSLRKHLADVNGESSRRAPMSRVRSAAHGDYGRWDGYSEQPSWDWRRREPTRRGSLEEDEDPYSPPAFFADGSRRSNKSTRRGLPTVWAS
ncbi:hypothetical protein CPB85DRAFT_78147 [Mucidula mucida]|nr:hypothetical protein CPB85DRAFT_78147 [Mucidula mucida]